LKEHGNIIYKLADFTSAAEQYRAAISNLAGPATVGAGCEVLVKRAERIKEGPMMQAAVVLCAEDDSVDIMYHEDDSEEDGVPLVRIIKCGPHETAPLQTSLYLNLARCYLSLPQSASTAVQYAERAVALATWAKKTGTGPGASHTTALYLRAKAHLARKRYKEALKDVEAALELDPGNKQALGLLNKIPKEQERSKKSDRRLAKEVAAWVGGAMEEVEKGKGPPLASLEEEDEDPEFEDAC